VTTRGLSPDLASFGADQSPRDLGKLELTSFVALLSRLTLIDPSLLGDDDPHLVVIGARGRFAVRPGRNGRLVLRDATAQHQSYLELGAADVPSYLDGHDPVATPAGQEPTFPSLSAPQPARGHHPSIGWAAFALAALLVAGSAFWTLRDETVDRAEDYLMLGRTEAEALQRRVTGTYESGRGDDARRLELRPDGSATYQEFDVGRAVIQQRDSTFAPALRRADQLPVLRATDLGPIEVRTAASVVFAGDVYQRVAAPVQSAPR